MKRNLAFMLSVLLLLCAFSAAAEEAYTPVKGAYSVTLSLPEGYVSAEDFADATTFVALVCCPGQPERPVLYLTVTYDPNDAYSSINALSESALNDWIITLRNGYMAEFGAVTVEKTDTPSGKAALVVTGAQNGAFLTEIYYLAGGYQVRAHVTAANGAGEETALSAEQLAEALSLIAGIRITAGS